MCAGIGAGRVVPGFRRRRRLLLGPCASTDLQNRGDCVGAWLVRRPAEAAGVLGHCHTPPVGHSLLPDAASAGASGWRGRRPHSKEGPGAPAAALASPFAAETELPPGLHAG